MLFLRNAMSLSRKGHFWVILEWEKGFIPKTEVTIFAIRHVWYSLNDRAERTWAIHRSEDARWDEVFRSTCKSPPRCTSWRYLWQRPQKMNAHEIQARCRTGELHRREDQEGCGCILRLLSRASYEQVKRFLNFYFLVFPYVCSIVHYSHSEEISSETHSPRAQRILHGKVVQTDFHCTDCRSHPDSPRDNSKQSIQTSFLLV